MGEGGRDGPPQGKKMPQRRTAAEGCSQRPLRAAAVAATAEDADTRKKDAERQDE